MEIDYKQAFIENVERLQKASGETRTDFARACGTTAASMARWENTDRVPHIGTAIKICEHANVSLDWLFGRAPATLDGLTQDQAEVATLYSAASENDKIVIHAVLDKYRKD